MADSIQDVRVKINRVEYDATCARAHQVLEQRLKGLETTNAWTSEDLATKFGKWQGMHRDWVWQVFEDQFAMMEQRLVGMEKVVGELKGLQAQMAKFQTS